MVCAALERDRDDALQRGLDRLGRLARRETGPVGDTKDVRVDSNRGFAESLVQNNVGGLAPHSGQRLEVGARPGDLATVSIQQRLAEREHIPSLVAKQADRLDVLADAVLAQGQHGGRCGRGGEQRPRRLVDAEVGGLSGQNHGHQERERIGIGQFGTWGGIDLGQPGEQS